MRTFIALLFFSTLLPAQFVPGKYIVELAEPAVAAAVPSARTGKAAVLQQAHQRIAASQSRLRADVESAGGRVLDTTSTVANTLMVEASEAVAAQLAARPDVKSVHKVRIFKPTMDRVVVLTHADQAWARIGVENAGKNIKIGIIDSGIDAAHPGFQDPSLTVPDGFPKIDSVSASPFTNSKIIVARSYASLFAASDPDTTPRDHVGHGTALAMCAAGVSNAGPVASITGMAPKAFLGNYKIFGTPGVNDSATDNAILKAIDDAVNDGMDIISMSFGSLLASRPEDDILVQAIARAETMGVIAVVAAGNDGPDPNTLSSPGTAPSAIAVGASSSDRQFSAGAFLSNGAIYAAIPGSASNDAPTVSGNLVAVTTLDPSGLACSPLPAGSLQSKVVLILRGTCNFENKLIYAQNAGAVGAIVYTDAARPSASIMAVGTATLPGAMVSNADGLAMQALLDSQANVNVDLSFALRATPKDSSVLANFTSLGPGPGGAIKPDMVAIGTDVYTATQKYDSNGDMYNAGGYIAVNGTSFSTPIVSGAAAVVKSIRPGLTAAEYRSLLINSASSYLENGYGTVQRSGSGLLNLDAAVQANTTVVPYSLSFGVQQTAGKASQTLLVHNIGAGPESYQVSITPNHCSTNPSVSTPGFDVPAGQSTSLTVEFDASLLAPGFCDGFVEIRGATAGTVARVPYWVGIPSPQPSAILLLSPSTSGRSGVTSTDLVFFRVLDSSAIALSAITPHVSVVSGGATIVDVPYRDADVSGAFGITLRLGRGTNVLQIEAGGISKQVTIVGR